MTQKDNILTASKGKVFKRIEDGQVYGNTIVLGYTYYINGIALKEPHLDVASDFEEIDEENEEAK